MAYNSTRHIWAQKRVILGFVIPRTRYVACHHRARGNASGNLLFLRHVWSYAAWNRQHRACDSSASGNLLFLRHVETCPLDRRKQSLKTTYQGAIRTAIATEAAAQRGVEADAALLPLHCALQKTTTRQLPRLPRLERRSPLPHLVQHFIAAKYLQRFTTAQIFTAFHYTLRAQPIAAALDFLSQSNPSPTLHGDTALSTTLQCETFLLGSAGQIVPLKYRRVHFTSRMSISDTAILSVESQNFFDTAILSVQSQSSSRHRKNLVSIISILCDRVRSTAVL